MNKLTDLNTIFFTTDGMCRFKSPSGEVARPIGRITVLSNESPLDYNVIDMHEILLAAPAPYSVVLHRKHIVKKGKGDELWAFASVWNPETGETGNLRPLGPILDIRFIDPQVLTIIGPHSTGQAA